VHELVELECKDWASKNINIKYEIRESRKGYKAGALKRVWNIAMPKSVILLPFSMQISNLSLTSF
jgi:hypothetical protein